MSTLVIPVRSDIYAYDFQVELQSVIYTLGFGFNTRANYWYMSISDQAKNLILGDIPLLSNIPLTDQYVDALLPPGRFIVIDETGKNRD